MLDKMADGDVAAVIARLEESQRTPDPTNALNLMAGAFPHRPPEQVRLVGYGTTKVNPMRGLNTETSDVWFESNYAATTWVLTNVVIRRVDGGDWRIAGLHIQSLPASIAVVNGFSFWDMGFVQYAFLLAMAAVAATTMAALVAWFRRRRRIRRRWWWLLAILVGAFRISINWITGAVAVQALTVQLLSFSASRDGIRPWVLSFSIPAGAIAFLIHCRRERRQEPSESVPALSS